MRAKLLQSCPTLCNPMDHSLPDSSVHGILQQEWSGLPFPPPGDLPDPGIEPMSLMSLALMGKFFTISSTWEAQKAGRATCKSNLHFVALARRFTSPNRTLASSSVNNQVLLPEGQRNYVKGDKASKMSHMSYTLHEY